ncbi:MAG TPA: hypothetical protein VJT31_32500, partial [Rugosimonospora sp.]|nr:hypothetical protein [Rugosimonospora sp.]
EREEREEIARREWESGTRAEMESRARESETRSRESRVRESRSTSAARHAVAGTDGLPRRARPTTEDVPAISDAWRRLGEEPETGSRTNRHSTESARPQPHLLDNDPLYDMPYPDQEFAEDERRYPVPPTPYSAVPAPYPSAPYSAPPAGYTSAPYSAPPSPYSAPPSSYDESPYSAPPAPYRERDEAPEPRRGRRAAEDAPTSGTGGGRGRRSAEQSSRGRSRKSTDDITDEDFWAFMRGEALR